MSGQLTDIAHTLGGTTLASSHYVLDVNGRRIAQTREDNQTERYAYDATSQLTGVDYGTGKTETFSYDPVGNRVEVARVVPNAPLGRENYQSNTLNQYTQVSSLAFTYDANGNLINDGKFVYGYDSQNRLISVTSALSTNPTPVHAEFFYDARNRCVLRKYYTRGSQGQWMLNTTDSRALTYDASWNLLAERTLNGAQVGEYIHGPRTDEILSARLGSKTYYPLADGLGSTVALTDKNGLGIERYRSTAYGMPTVLKANYQPQTAASATGYRFLFTGREWLAGVQLNDHRNRYYSPSLGRWLSTDPIGFKGGLNLYAYLNQDPINHTDCRGLDNPGCDIPTLGSLVGTCQLKCCAAHDDCYYRNTCSAASWRCPAAILPCTFCNASVAACLVVCEAGISNDGPLYFCPNGPYQGQSYNNLADVPASCWESGIHP